MGSFGTVIAEREKERERDSLLSVDVESFFQRTRDVEAVDVEDYLRWLDLYS